MIKVRELVLQWRRKRGKQMEKKRPDNIENRRMVRMNKIEKKKRIKKMKAKNKNKRSWSDQEK